MSKGSNNTQLRELFRRRAEWELHRDRITYFFELGFIFALFILSITTLYGSFPLPIQVSAIGALCFVGRAVISHLTRK